MIEIERVTKSLWRPARRRGIVADRARGRVLRAARSVRLRQIDDIAHDQPADAVRLRRDPGRRRGCRRVPPRRCGAASATRSSRSACSRIGGSRTTSPPCRGSSNGRARASATGSTELLQLLRLEPESYRGKYPHQLSGGEQQRVGVARALAADPELLLMDEPFAAVDPITRAALQDEMLRIQRATKKTIVFVTHDIEEALRLASGSP